MYVLGRKEFFLLHIAKNCAMHGVNISVLIYTDTKILNEYIALQKLARLKLCRHSL